MTKERQAQVDRIAYDMYLDVGLSYTEAARQLGVPVRTVRARVRRHVMRMPRLSEGRKQ